jgi:hypothetical protein
VLDEQEGFAEVRPENTSDPGGARFARGRVRRRRISGKLKVPIPSGFFRQCSERGNEFKPRSMIEGKMTVNVYAITKSDDCGTFGG